MVPCKIRWDDNSTYRRNLPDQWFPVRPGEMITRPATETSPDQWFSARSGEMIAWPTTDTLSVQWLVPCEIRSDDSLPQKLTWLMVPCETRWDDNSTCHRNLTWPVVLCEIRWDDSLTYHRHLTCWFPARSGEMITQPTAETLPDQWFPVR